MPWIDRAITPYHLPFGENGLTYDPGLVVEVEDLIDLAGSRVWTFAPLTQIARRKLPPLMREAWHVRRRGDVDARALVLKLRPHRLVRRLISMTPERAAIAPGYRLIVMTTELVVTVHGSDPERAFGHVADIFEGTRPLPRGKARPSTAPAIDVEEISALFLDRPPR